MHNQPVDQKTLNLLHRAFEIVLEQNKISYNKIGIAEEGEQLLFLYETNEEKVHVFKWSKAASVGMSIGTLAQSVLTPIIPQLRLLS
jgi:5,10-methylenetetrahydrofolate reductase